MYIHFRKMSVKSSTRYGSSFKAVIFHILRHESLKWTTEVCWCLIIMFSKTRHIVLCMFVFTAWAHDSKEFRVRLLALVDRWLVTVPCSRLTLVVHRLEGWNRLLTFKEKEKRAILLSDYVIASARTWLWVQMLSGATNLPSFHGNNAIDGDRIVGPVQIPLIVLIDLAKAKPSKYTPNCWPEDTIVHYHSPAQKWAVLNGNIPSKLGNGIMPMEVN